jgi:hypothetical protein
VVAEMALRLQLICDGHRRSRFPPFGANKS